MEATVNQEREQLIWKVIFLFMPLGIFSLGVEFFSDSNFQISILFAIIGVVLGWIMWRSMENKSRTIKVIFAIVMLGIIVGEYYNLSF